jgi:ubiquinone/menaquinone biosynthesis C-methylase UbiE
MLDVTRRCVETEEPEGVEYHVGDSSPTIAFSDEAFDVVLSTFGASFSRSPTGE